MLQLGNYAISEAFVYFINFFFLLLWKEKKINKGLTWLTGSDAALIRL